MAEHGNIVIDGNEVATTLRCPHCGGHFVSMRGSGARRTFCRKCMAVTCGKHQCDACSPFEAQLEQMEKQAIIIARG